MTEDQAGALEALAESEGVSKSEIVRRALARYRGNEAVDDEEAAAVLAQLSEKLDEAIAAVAETVEQLDRVHQQRDEEMAAERARVIAWAEEHPDELDALARAISSAELQSSESPTSGTWG